MAQVEGDPRELALAVVFLILCLGLFAAAGTSDWQSEQAYLEAWHEQNGIVEEVAP